MLHRFVRQDTSTRKEMGKINMLVASVKQGTVRRFSFDVATPNRIYRFQASSRTRTVATENDVNSLSNGRRRNVRVDEQDA